MPSAGSPRRKLTFSDAQIAAAVRKCRIPVKDIAAFEGVHEQTVWGAIRRHEDWLTSPRATAPALHRRQGKSSDIAMFAHRDTGDGDVAAPTPPVDYCLQNADPLELHEIDDLIREWGAA